MPATGPSPEPGSGRLAGRIALITGASRGLGAAVARRFAAEGAKLILTARTVGGLEETDDAVREASGQRATLVPLDLREFDLIDQLGASLFQRFGHLDVLVANAGVLGVLSPVGHIDPKVWTETFELNVTANYRLIRSLDLLLRRSDSGRAIFVTSGAASMTNAYWAPYAASKAALEMLTKTYAAEVTKTQIRVNLASPGALRTRMRKQAFPGEDPMSLPEPDSVTGLFVDLAAADCTRHGEVISP